MSHRRVESGSIDATTRQIRGSSLLLVGRGLALIINMVAQVLMVRYLSKSDFGAFAYALALVTMGQQVATFGLDRAVTRFLPMFDERDEHGALLGTLLLVVSIITFLGLGMVLLVQLTQDNLLTTFVSDSTTIAVLVVLVMLAPVQALDDVLIGLFAVFSSPRAIFARRYLLGPGLRLGVVLALIAAGSDVIFLALGWVLAGAAGVVLYTIVLLRQLNRRGLLRRMRAAPMRVPARAVFGFTIPLLTSDLVYILMNTTDVLILGHFHGTEAVAAYRVVQPAANLNLLVTSSFALLYTPAAARLIARDDHEQMDALYWRTAGWLAVLAFPLMAVTVALSGPVTTTLWGERYESSAIYLTLLSLGLYFNGALGFNGLTLKVLGRMRYIVTVNVAAAVVNVALNLVLIPRFGALGAAIGTASTLVVYNVAKQIGVARGTHISAFRRSYTALYVMLAGATALLTATQVILDPPIVISGLLAALVSVAVLWAGRSTLDLAGLFPELARMPVVGGWLTR